MKSILSQATINKDLNIFEIKSIFPLNCGVFSVLYLPPLSLSYSIPIVHNNVSGKMYVGLWYSLLLLFYCNKFQRTMYGSMF